MEGQTIINKSTSRQPLFIRDGRVVNDDGAFDADIVTEDGIITKIGKNLNIPEGSRTIDAKGKMVIPGGIDTHTHMQLPFMGTTSVDDFYHGTRAALAGGTTMIMDFVIPEKGENFMEAYDKWRGWADAKVCCDYGLHFAITWWGKEPHKDMETLAKEKGINSFKMFMAYKDIYQITDAELYESFKRSRNLGAIALVHAENGDLIAQKSQEVFDQGITGPEGHILSSPEEGEAEATNRAIVLAEQADCPLFVVHVMAKGAAEHVANARKRGQMVFGEALAAGLGSDGTHYYHKCWRHAAGHLFSPPTRDLTTQKYLMECLASNDLQVTGSDHCTYNSEQKAAGKDDFRKIPNGVNGVEDRMSVIWENGVVTGKMDASRFVAVTSTNAAKIFNIYPKKGSIAVGSDADLVIWDPNAKRTISAKSHHQACDFNIFEGMECHGVAQCVISGGRVVVDEDGLHVIRASGRYVPMPCYAESVYGNSMKQEKIRKYKPVQRENSSSGNIKTSSVTVATKNVLSAFMVD